MAVASATAIFIKNMNTITKETKSTTSKIFHDDVYLIDATTYCTVISSRRGAEGLTRGESFLDILDTQTKNELFAWLSSFDTSPLNIKTSIGNAVIYGGLFPSTTLFVARFLYDVEEDEVFCLGSIALSETLPKKDALCEQAIAVSELCGCPVDINTDEFIEPLATDPILSKFDFPLYTAFLINTLLLSRRVSRTREAEIIIKTKEESPYVSVILEPIDDAKDVYEELSSLENIAERLRLVFTRAIRDGKLTVTISPVRKNWALLGIKTPFEFSWDD